MSVKGDIIKQPIDKPQVNYRKIEALNQSMIALFDSDPVKFYEEFKLGKRRERKESASIIIGDVVDFYLLECRADEEEFNQRFDEKFVLSTETKGQKQVFLLADVLYQVTEDCLDEDNKITLSFDTRFNEAFQKVQSLGKYSGKTCDKALEDFNENALSYFNSRLDNIGKTPVEESILQKAKEISTQLIEDEFTKDIFKGNDDLEYLTKYPIEWEFMDTKCKSEIDIILIDHDKKIVYPKDLKTTYDNEGFEYSYIKHYYYLQGSFYFKAIEYWMEKEGMKDYKISPIEFIVGDTSVNKRRPIRYCTTLKDLLNGINGFYINKNYYRGLGELVAEIKWCEENNIWNCSKKVFDNNGILQLNVKYD